MNTDTKKKEPKKRIPRVIDLSVNTGSNSLVELVEKMRSVDTESKEAKLNATSISDNNGGRIDLNKDDYIKK